MVPSVRLHQGTFLTSWVCIYILPCVCRQGKYIFKKKVPSLVGHSFHCLFPLPFLLREK